MQTAVTSRGAHQAPFFCDAPRLPHQLIGVLNIGYFAAGTFQGLADKDYPTAIFPAVGAGSSASAAFGGGEMLGGVAGPIGIAVATAAVVALHFVEQHHEQRNTRKHRINFPKVPASRTPANAIN